MIDVHCTLLPIRLRSDEHCLTNSLWISRGIFVVSTAEYFHGQINIQSINVLRESRHNSLFCPVVSALMNIGVGRGADPWMRSNMAIIVFYHS